MKSLVTLFSAIPLILGVSVLSVHADEEPASPPSPAANADAVRTVVYRCESGNEITVRYDNTRADAPTARLAYKNRTFDLYNVRSASGARYATEQGLLPDKGLQWWTKGGEATLSEMLLDHTAPEPAQIENCKAQAEHEQAADSQGELPGTAWRLSTLRGEGLPSSKKSTLALAQDGKVAGHGGCNGFGGSAKIDGGSIKFGDLFSTRMACEEAVMKQERAFHEALRDTASYRLVDGDLVLQDKSGKETARLVPAE